MSRATDQRFIDWCEQPWHTMSNGAVIPRPVHVTPRCLEQVRAADPKVRDCGQVCFKIAAQYYADLRARYHVGQVRHELAPPLHGSWYILLYLDMLYVDDREHPLPTRVRATPLPPD